MSTGNLTPLRVLPTVIESPSSTGRAATEIYRPFFLSGILTVLTAGCLLGAIALLGVAIQGNFSISKWTPYVLAHANSQLYGWVGFFVMGFALQQHAPMVSKKQLFHRLAYTSLSLMAVGIVLRFFAEPLIAVDGSRWLVLGISSTLLQAAAVIIFMLNIAVTRYREGDWTWPTKLVVASLAWWLSVALVEPFYFAYSHTASQATDQKFINEWALPHREAQFLGFVTMMIFGVAFVKFHSCFGAKEATRKLGLAGFYLWNIALLSRMFGWVWCHRIEHLGLCKYIYQAGGGLLLISAVLLVMGTRVFESVSERLRSHKFLRGAMFWFVFACALAAFEPVHLALTGKAVSHAYTGGIRHAITVGFISQMIIGISIHVVARMNNLAISRLPSLMSVFILLNLGNALRVILEIGTDYSPSLFAPMGYTGFIELTALVIWASHMVPNMLRARRVFNAS